jgi:hypothetical protein
MIAEVLFDGNNNDFQIDQSDDPADCGFGWDCPDGTDKIISLREVNPEPWEDTGSCNKGDKSDILTVKAMWGGGDGRLESIGVRFEDGTANEGGAKINNGTIKLKNGCEIVIRIGNSSEPAKVYTNRINHVGDYENLTIDGKNYDAKCGPWGSLSLDQGQDPTVYIIENTNVCPAWSPTPEGTVYNQYGSGPGWDLHQLFLSPPEAYVFDDQTYRYEQSAITPFWDDSQARGLSSPPTITSVSCTLQGDCSEELGGTGKITLGNSSSASITSTGIYNAILKFYAYANSNQMPLIEIMIDWNGDGWSSSNPGPDDNNFDVVAQNHRGKGECNNTEFGRSSQACTENYFQLIHTYYCSGSSSPDWNSSLGACVFTPKVNVIDNWDKESGWISYGNTVTVKPYSGW